MQAAPDVAAIAMSGVGSALQGPQIKAPDHARPRDGQWEQAQARLDMGREATRLAVIRIRIHGREAHAAGNLAAAVVGPGSRRESPRRRKRHTGKLGRHKRSNPPNQSPPPSPSSGGARGSDGSVRMPGKNAPAALPPRRLLITPVEGENARCIT